MKYFKRLYFCQVALFMMFFIVIRSRNIWPMIYWLGAFQIYLSLNFDHLQRVGAEYALPIYSLHQSSAFLVQQLIFRQDETSQGKKRTKSERSTKVETLSIIDVAQTFLRDLVARLPETWNQVNATCKQLRSTKFPQCAWSIRRDLETFPVGNIPWQLIRCISGQGGAYPFIFFTEVWRVDSSLEKSVKAFLIDQWNRAKGFNFFKSLYLQCFSLLSGQVISDQ